MKIQLTNEQSTLEFGAKLAGSLPSKGIVFLVGNLGAGKTTLVRGFLKAMGHKGSTKSPTYTLVEPYQVLGNRVYHFDLYRVDDAEELEYMGFRDYLQDSALCFVEWPENGGQFLPEPDLILTLEYAGQQRIVDVQIKNKDWKNTLNGIFESHF